MAAAIALVSFLVCCVLVMAWLQALAELRESRAAHDRALAGWNESIGLLKLANAELRRTAALAAIARDYFLATTDEPQERVH